MAEEFEEEDELVEAEVTPEIVDIKIPDKAKWRDIEKKREERDLKKIITDGFDDYPDDI